MLARGWEGVNQYDHYYCREDARRRWPCDTVLHRMPETEAEGDGIPKSFLFRTKHLTGTQCNREWPCNHCSARRVPNLCQFGTKSSSVDSPPSTEPTKEANGKKRKGTDGIGNFDPSNPTDVPIDGLKLWGYMPENPFYDLEGAKPPVASRLPSSVRSVMSMEIQDALKVVPARSLTDTLVQEFLRDWNYMFYCIYPPTFLEKYSQWWADRTAGKDLCKAFTCLLLRVLSCSTQYLLPAMTQKIEYEMSETVQTLTERYHHAAEKLSKTFGPGDGGFTQVQQLYLRLQWFKSESLFIESWHAMADCIREAQELGEIDPFH
jgi:hypothetical protein